MSEPPRPGDNADDERRQRPEPDTEQFPIGRVSAQVFNYDDIGYGPIGASPAEGGADRVNLYATGQPSDLVRRYIFDTEKFRGEWRRHWIHLVKRLSIGVLATFILGYIAGYFAKEGIQTGLTLLVAAWIGVISWVLWWVAEWYYDRFVLTNKRVMLIEGIIARKVAMLPLQRVTDMKYTQSPLGRILGYGKFEIESAGQNQALRNISNLPKPTDLYLQVVEEMYEPDASEARRRPQRVDDGL
jgi:membrane protein YdbS with pleckstrin-like domain